MADKPKPSIPSWQQPNANATVANNDSGSSPTSDSDNTSRSALVEQASKFLQDDSIRDAPVDRKISFLESKGLRSDEIEGLLGVSRNPEATSSAATTAEEKKSETTTDEPTPAPSPSPSPQTTSSSPAPPTTAAPRPAPSPSPSPSRGDVPPIITYPEFLVNQPKPPPLVTLRSMLYTLYGAAGIGASIYGASEFLVKPMLASLTSAREELAATASSNLQKLNEKLEQNVSTLPPQLTARQKTDASTAGSENGGDDDDSSITSDPTELFHRDVATQTSQELTQDSLSSAVVNAADEAAALDPLVGVNTHLKRLEIITSNLREFADLDKSSGALDDSMRTDINDLQHYLDGLLYSKPGFGGVTSYGVYSTPGIGDNGPSTGITKGEEEAISGFRSEIRGVKGALLSARNFPSGRGGRVGSSLSLGR